MSASILKSKRAALVKKLAAIDTQIAEVTQVESGDKPAPAIAALIKSQKFSFSVVFVRRKELTKTKRTPKGLSFTSVRRFSTQKEATQHGRRFAKKHNHKSFHVIEVSKKANAWINWKTGKTNPVIGL